MSTPEFRPYIPASKTLRELTAVPLLVGTLLGIVFGASSLYLVLKVGLTVSASIPVAVISITLYRVLGKVGLREATILEHNVVQTAGSAGESIAFGVGVTMPAIMILGFDLEITRVALVAVLGGVLGILMMIPLRRALIVDQHGELKYPEGTACAEVLKAGASAESREAADPEAVSSSAGELGGKTIFAGFTLGILYKALMVAGRAWKDTPEKLFGAPLKGASVAAEISPELLGVGYIIGPKISSTMCAGGVLAYLVLIPMIRFFGDSLGAPLAPGTIPISEMGPHEIRGAYVLYIGAGAVAAGGIISMARSLPTIVSAIKSGLRDIRARRSGSAEGATRTNQDISPKVVLIGVLILMTVIVLAPPLGMNVLGAILIVAFGFLFVTVSSRLTGEIGSSSNPISGMTVATLLLTCGIFLLLKWTGPSYYVTALSVGAIVCIAASNGGTTSQDLKTGFLIGATPRLQQIAIVVGALASALVLGPILLALNDAATVYVPQETKDATSGEMTQVFAKDLATDASKLTQHEHLTGPQLAADAKDYLVWQKPEADASGPAGRYLIEPSSGKAIYLVDPGINGTHNTRPDGSRVTKFDAPKATLMSYIIKGILNQKLPWALVLLGVMIAVVLEMAGIPSLAFAVGVYLPISSSTPILVGGFIRWLVDRHTSKKLEDRLQIEALGPEVAYREKPGPGERRKPTEEELAAEGDKSPGVLLASGYIAGGAIAGVVIAFVAGLFGDLQSRIEEWSTQHNPAFAGPHADVLCLVPFVLISVLLYLVGREVVMAPPPSTSLPGAKKRTE